MTPTRKALVLVMGLALGVVVVLVLDSISARWSKPVKLRFICKPGRVAVYKTSADIRRFWRYANNAKPYRFIREHQSISTNILQGTLSAKPLNLISNTVDDRKLIRYVLYRHGEAVDKTEFRRNLVESQIPLPELRVLERDELGRTRLAANRLSLSQLYSLLEGVLHLPEKPVKVGDCWSGQQAMGMVLVKWRWCLTAIRLTEKGNAADIEGTVEFLRHPNRIGRCDIKYTLLTDIGLIQHMESHILFVCHASDTRFQLEYQERSQSELRKITLVEPEAATQQLSHIKQFLAALTTGDGEEVLRQLSLAATSSPIDNPLLPVYHRLIKAAKEALERDRIKKLLEELKQPHHHHHHEHEDH